MTKITIKKNASIRNPSHNGRLPGRLYHDDIVYRIIKKMRKIGSCLIEYDECSDEFETTMIFGSRGRKTV